MTGNLRASRHLDLEGAYNIRDIGGYETVDGRRTRPRTLFRSDSLHNLTPDSQSALVIGRPAYGGRPAGDQVRRGASERLRPVVGGGLPLGERHGGRAAGGGRRTYASRRSAPTGPPTSTPPSSTVGGSGWARSSSSSRRPVRSRPSTTATPVATAQVW